jgi:hypothetical protein
MFDFLNMAALAVSSCNDGDDREKESELEEVHVDFMIVLKGESKW